MYLFFSDSTKMSASGCVFDIFRQGASPAKVIAIITEAGARRLSSKSIGMYHSDAL
jgi:hypothetical protein